MSSPTPAPATLQRLRANATAAGIILSDDDLARIASGPFLNNVENFERLLRTLSSAALPDSLADWSDASTQVPTTAGPTTAQATTPDDPLDPYAPLHVVAAAVQSKALSPVELTDATLARIAALDPTLNAFQLLLADEARAAARQAAQEIANGHYRGPFHGVPIAVKDLLAITGHPTTAGSRILADWVPTANATAITRLHQAGAIIVGKTRLSEFAYSPGSNNAHYGPTRNPWNPDYDTGGSSSGSGSAVAAGLAYLALGSDTGGSIRIPSALCGIVGLKPTHGLLSLAGVATLAWSMDHLGPMTRSVRDAALALNLLAGHDPADSRTRHLPARDYTLGLDSPTALRGLRIGAVRDDGSPLGPPDPAALAAWETGLRALQEAGATIIDLALPDLEALRTIGTMTINLEAVTYHEPHLRDRPHDLGPFPRDRLLVAYAYGPMAYVQAQQARALLRASMNHLLAQVDLLSTPAMPGPALPLGTPHTTRCTIPFNALGWPALVVPTGLTADNLPLGIQVAGRPWDDHRVLQAGQAIERGVNFWHHHRPDAAGQRNQG